MTTEEYWERDPYLVQDFKRAHLLTIEQRNQELWLQGLYIYKAFGVIMSNAFSKKGNQKEKYFEKPLRITPYTKQEKAKRTEEERQKIIAELTAWEKAWNKQKQ